MIINTNKLPIMNQSTITTSRRGEYVSPDIVVFTIAVGYVICGSTEGTTDLIFSTDPYGLDDYE